MQLCSFVRALARARRFVVPCARVAALAASARRLLLIAVIERVGCGLARPSRPARPWPLIDRRPATRLSASSSQELNDGSPGEKDPRRLARKRRHLSGPRLCLGAWSTRQNHLLPGSGTSTTPTNAAFRISGEEPAAGPGRRRLGGRRRQVLRRMARTAWITVALPQFIRAAATGSGAELNTRCPPGRDDPPRGAGSSGCQQAGPTPCQAASRPSGRLCRSEPACGQPRRRTESAAGTRTHGLSADR